LSEWARDGWTYHAKGIAELCLVERLPNKPFNDAVLGIWFSEPEAPRLDRAASNNSAPAPSLTLFGSTNLNERSATLDTELSFLMHTTSPALRQRLGEEVGWLWKDSATVNEDVWREEGRRMGGVSWGTRAIMSIVGHML
jgi:CDP-diacylglycerol--glycerol-3-phosphate 3-phosphatidyltransferase